MANGQSQCSLLFNGDAADWSSIPPWNDLNPSKLVPMAYAHVMIHTDALSRVEKSKC
jgi:hypothetical protein